MQLLNSVRQTTNANDNAGKPLGFGTVLFSQVEKAAHVAFQAPEMAYQAPVAQAA